jgi:hypothetical protein
MSKKVNILLLLILVLIGLTSLNIFDEYIKAFIEDTRILFWGLIATFLGTIFTLIRHLS